MNNRFVLFFNEIDRRDLPQVGGKGANLGEMTRAGFPVPFGFCVSTKGYRSFIEHNKLSAYIADNIGYADNQDLETTSARIRDKISQAEMPDEILQSISNALKEVGEDNYFAIRSSATAEDLAFASFAGQQDTYLNIRGEKEILRAIKDCWASLFTDRAILYRIQNKIEHAKVDMSVVVQKMVLPDVAGIMFTADPVSGHRGMVSIDAGYGLGEALVSGLVSPDIYKFRKKSLRIERKIVAEKKLAIAPIPGGGTKKVEISGEKSKSQVLSDSKIAELAELGMRIEKHYGCPQDIEWCMEKDNFYVVQSRPITSLFPLPEPLPDDNALHTYLSFNHIQVMTDPISPMGLDIFKNMFTDTIEDRIKSENKLLPSSAGRIFIDIKGALHFEFVRRKIVSYINNMDPLIAESLSELLERPEVEAELRKNGGNIYILCKIIIPTVVKIGYNLLFRNPEGTVSYLNNIIEQYEREKTCKIQRYEKGSNRIYAVEKYGYFFDVFFEHMLPRLAPGIISLKLLERMEKKLLGTNCYVNAISKGLEGNITTEMGLLTGDLADMIRKSPELMKEFNNEDYKTLIYRISQMKGNEEFKLAFNSFMMKYGIRAAGEIDIARERWSENPEPLAKSIIATVYSSREGVHRKEYSEMIAKAKAAANDMVNEVKAKHGSFKAKLVKRLIEVLRYCLPAREHHKFLMMRLRILMIGQMKRTGTKRTHH